MDKIILDLRYAKSTRNSFVYADGLRPNASFVGMYLLKRDMEQACRGDDGYPMNIRVTVEEIEP